MFDIGFLEIFVILIITLLVIGPKRMPEVARKIGHLMGKMRRFVNTVKEDRQMQDTINDFKNSMNLAEQKEHVNTINQELQSALELGNDVKLEDFQRPNFGGDHNDAETTSIPSQYNKAPSQPLIPKIKEQSVSPSETITTPEVATTTTPTEQPTTPPMKVASANQTDTKKS